MKLGYQRIKDSRRHDDGVQWWYFWEYEDGWAFARGGRCRTIREARRLLRDCHWERECERQAFLNRPALELTPDGEMRPAPQSPYAAVK